MTEHNFGHRAVHVGPPKTALVQFLRTDPQTATVIHDQFQAVAPRIRENENVPALGSAAQMIAHQTVETTESGVLPFPQVKGSLADPQLAADLTALGARLMLLQGSDDLLLRVLLPGHVDLPV